MARCTAEGADVRHIRREGRLGQSPAISADGCYVAFVSLASNLVRGDTNYHRDLFARRLKLWGRYRTIGFLGLHSRLLRQPQVPV